VNLVPVDNENTVFRNACAAIIVPFGNAAAIVKNLSAGLTNVPVLTVARSAILSSVRVASARVSKRAAGTIPF
jgi:hypothetical protein